LISRSAAVGSGTQPPLIAIPHSGTKTIGLRSSDRATLIVDELGTQPPAGSTLASGNLQVPMRSSGLDVRAIVVVLGPR